jgi:hypothetical protein
VAMIKNDSNENGNLSLWSLIYYSTKSAKQFILLVSLIAITMALFVGVAYGIISILNGKKVVIEQTPSGGLIYKVGNEETLSFLLSASVPWANTSFHLRGGDRLTFRASGTVNTAFHHLIHSAETDSMPSEPWIGPDGIPNDKLHLKQDIYRERYRVMPTSNYGALIGGIGTATAPPSRIEDMFLIGSENEITVPPNKSGYLWLIVNEVMLTPDHPDAYEVPKESSEKGYAVPRKFQDLKAESYWNVWYDDNIGDFFVTVKKESR